MLDARDVAEFIEEEREEEREILPAISLLDLPVAGFQIMQAGDTVTDGWPNRADVSPVLAQNADGLWALTVRRQGKHGEFSVPYIGSEILLADAEIGLVVVLVGYHGTETYGRKKNKRVPKGQFWRFYRQESDGSWRQLHWQRLNDETRQLILDLERPEWARAPGKLSSERKPPAKPVEMTAYKVVRVIDGRYYSLHSPEIEYVLGQRMKQPAKPGHGGGYFSHATAERGVSYLESCLRVMPFHSEVETPALALVECEIGGKIISYGHKLCSTYLCPIRVLEIRNLN